MAVISFKCPNCDGELIFDPETQKYKCEYCGSKFTQAELDALQPAESKEMNAGAADGSDEAEQEKRAEACSEDAENKAALSKNLLKRGNLLMQMGDKEGAGKDMQRYLQLNPEKIEELTGEFKAEGREHCR